MVDKDMVENKNSYIDLAKIKQILTISDANLFHIYMKEIYKDLIERAESSKTSGVSKVNFYEYMKMPIFICEKLFNVFDKDADGFLNVKEFVEGFNSLYYGSFKQTAKIIFSVYDFDKDGYINKEDVKVLFSYLPLKSEDRQKESLIEIDQILSKVKFDKNFNYSKFLDTIVNVQSDLYLQPMCYFIDFKPFAVENVEVCRNLPKYKEFAKSNYEINKDKLTNTPTNTFFNENVTLSSPPKTTCFKPLDSIINLIDLEDFNLDGEEDSSKIKLLEPREIKHVHIDKSDISKQQEMIRMSNQRQVLGDNFQTPTKYLKQVPNNLDIEPFDLDPGRKASDNNFIIAERKYSNNNPGLARKSSLNLITKSGVVYKITENRNLKSYFLVLCNKDIYYYKNETCKDLLGMHNLSGCYIGDASVNGLKYDSKTLFTFTLLFSNKSRAYYCGSQEEAESWVKTLKDAIGYQSFSENYDIKDKIDSGKFGDVFLGIHKKTKQYVAIKTIKKESMTPKDIELVKSEIDIMKMCKHPNIVRLLDHFENSQFTFIVMEYLSGGTLANYLEHTPVDDLSEKDTAKIAYQIACALEYLHQFGIVHRDLKPENIMIKGKLPHES
jgi:Ca2+-binding EF-hand superfamily protein